MKYKLIAIDMDGTLLNSENQISERNKKALWKAKDQGIYVVLSTGRILRSALYYGETIGLDNPIIACNGAIVASSNGEDILYERFMETNSSKRVIELAEENNIYYHFYNRDTFYTKEVSEEAMKYYESFENNMIKQQINMKILKKPIEVFKRENPKVYKFVFIEDKDKDKLLDFREKLKEVEGINISSSWSNNIEVMGTGVSKGNGLKHLCEILNIDKSEVVAMGDNENDIPMLKFAGLAVAMKNGDEIIREHSHVITDINDEDGVAKAIEKYVLK